MQTPDVPHSHARLVICLSLALALLGSPRSGFGQAGTIDPSFVRGPGFLSVSKLALQSGGKVLLAGGFTDYGGNTSSNLARLQADGTFDPSFDPGAGLAGPITIFPGVFTNIGAPQISAFSVQGDDKILIGGQFTIGSGAVRTNLARLNPNGDLDLVFDPRPDNQITGLLPQSGGKVWVGGAFKNIGGSARKAIALLNSDGSADGSFVPNWGSLIPGNVAGIAVQTNGQVLAAGGILKLVGVTPVAVGIARFNSDGSPDGGFTSPNLASSSAYFTSVAVQGDGTILVAGTFGTINGAVHNGIARLNADGSLDPNWVSAGAGGTLVLIQSLRLQADGKALIAGNFSSYDGTPRAGIARLNRNGSLDTTFANPPISTGLGVGAMDLQIDGKVLIGGGFSVGADATSLLRLIGDSSSSPTAPKITTDPLAQTVAARASAIFTVVVDSPAPVSYQWRLNGADLPNQHGPKLTIPSVQQTDGGLYTVLVSNSGGESVISREALLNPVAPAWPDLAFPNTGIDPLLVNALFLQNDGKILVAGHFTKVSGFTRNRVARLNADGSVDTGFTPPVSATVEMFGASAQSSGKAIVVGNLSWPNENQAYGVGRLNLNGSLDQTFNVGTGTDDAVFAVAVQNDDKVLLGGFFGHVNGIARAAIARLNVNGDVDTGFVPNVQFPQVISAIAIQPVDGKILIGGKTGGNAQFPTRNILRLDTAGLVDASFTPGTGPNDQVRSIVAQAGGKILIGGEFTQVDGVSRNGVARLNANGSLDLTFDTSASPFSPAFVWSVAVQSDGKVIVGGAFEKFGEIPRRKIVRLNSNGSVDDSFVPADGASNDEIKAVLMLPDGKILAAGNFTTYDGFTVNRLVRLHGGGPVAGAQLQYSLTGTDLTFTWTDVSYTLQTTTSLAPLSWGDVPGGSPKTVSTLTGVGFYRLIQKP